MNPADVPDGRREAGWSILEAEWTGHVQACGRFRRALVQMAQSTAVLAALFGFAVGWPLYRILELEPVFRTERDWMQLALQAVAACFLGRGMLRQLLDAIPQALRWRRRGPRVWGLRARVCPDCLAPFDEEGRATCGHRYSASMQPGILRLLEAQATDDARREREARIALAAASDALAGRSRARRRALRALHLALTVAAFWIVAGPNLFGMLGAAALGALIAIYVQRASRIERCTVECTACKHLVHDIARQSVCPECAADLSAPAAVRGTAETNEAAMGNRRLVGAAALLGFTLVVPYLPRLLPTSALTGLIDLSIGRVSSIEKELGRRALTPAERVSATGALVRHQFGSAQSGYILADFAKQAVSEGALDESTLGVIGSGLRAEWRVAGRTVDADGPAVVSAAGGDSVELSARLSRDLAFIGHPVVFVGPVSIRRLDGAVGGGDDAARAGATILSDRCMTPPCRVALPALEPGRYELAGECVVVCMPFGSPHAFPGPSARAIGDLPATAQRARRTFTAAVVAR